MHSMTMTSNPDAGDDDLDIDEGDDADAYDDHAVNSLVSSSRS